MTNSTTGPLRLGALVALVAVAACLCLAAVATAADQPTSRQTEQVKWLSPDDEITKPEPPRTKSPRGCLEWLASHSGRAALRDMGAETGPIPPRENPNPAHYMVDLSHPLHNKTLHWPTLGDVQYTVQMDAERNNTDGTSYYIKTDSLSAPIHTGTHLDAPRHFSKTGWTVDQIPLERLVDVPFTVVDLSAKVSANRSYSFVKSDFETGESISLVKPQSVVLVYTGISTYYDQGQAAYLGTPNATADISQMRVPGFSQEAAEYLVARGVYGVGLDAPSADSSDRHGHQGLASFDPKAHVAFSSSNVYIIENINRKMNELIGETEGRLTAAALPIVGGSGSQVRLVAVGGHDDHLEKGCPANSASEAVGGYSSVAVVTTAFAILVAFLA